MRLITELMPYLLPGVQTEFPHHSVAFRVAASATPNVTFAAGAGMPTSAAFDTTVYVLPSNATAPVAAARAAAGSGVAEAVASWLQARSRAGGAGDAAAAAAAAAAPVPGAVEVARLRATVTATVDVAFHRSHLSGLRVAYEVVSSRYAVVASHWDATAAFAINELAHTWGLQHLYSAFAPPGVAGMFRPHRVAARYLDGWYAVSTDVEVDTSQWPGR